MTVNVETPIVKYTYSAPAELAFNFKVFEEDDLEVRFVEADGTVTILTINTDYTVTIDPDLGGGDVAVTYVPSGGYGPPDVYIHIARVLPISQLTDWVNNNPFNMDILENNLDKLTMLIQEYLAAQDGLYSTSGWLGDWVTAFNYNVLDIVKAADNNYYIATATHTSGVWATDFAAGIWSLYLNMADITASLPFTGLTDSPANYTGAAGRTVKVNSTPDGVEFVDMSATATEFSKTQNFNATTLIDAASVAWDCESNQVCSVTLTANRTMAAPTNIVAGAFYSIQVVQDGIGSRTLTWNSAFEFAGGVAPTLSLAASSVDHLVFRGQSGALREVGRSMNIG